MVHGSNLPSVLRWLCKNWTFACKQAMVDQEWRKARGSQLCRFCVRQSSAILGLWVNWREKSFFSLEFLVAREKKKVLLDLYPIHNEQELFNHCRRMIGWKLENPAWAYDDWYIKPQEKAVMCSQLCTFRCSATGSCGWFKPQRLEKSSSLSWLNLYFHRHIGSNAGGDKVYGFCM